MVIVEQNKLRQVGKRIRQRRREKRLSQVALADLVGCNATTIKDYENGSRVPSGTNLFHLSRALHCSMDWFFADWTAEMAVRF